jgi:branched-chain amino acid transport system ATP-binding protein
MTTAERAAPDVSRPARGATAIGVSETGEGIGGSHALLEVRNVTKRFGGIVANRDVSLDVPAGRITGLIGPNGSGKTTLFNSIAGQHPIDGGSIRFEGREISRLRTARIARLGIVRTFQQTRVYRAMNCVQNMQISTAQAGESLASALRRPSAAVTERAEALLEFVGLRAKRLLPAGELSFGQQKLLEFAMALMSGPRLLLLDEPTAGINPVLINGLVDRLKRANAELGITLLVIEHNMRVIMNLASHIYCLAHGELLAQGTPDAIVRDPRVVDAYLGGR